MTTPTVMSARELPPTSRQWFVLEVMKRKSLRSKEWSALVIDIDPDEFRAGLTWHIKNQSCFLCLGKHSSRDAAFECAEKMLATHH